MTILRADRLMGKKHREKPTEREERERERERENGSDYRGEHEWSKRDIDSSNSKGVITHFLFGIISR